MAAAPAHAASRTAFPTAGLRPVSSTLIAELSKPSSSKISALAEQPAPPPKVIATKKELKKDEEQPQEKATSCCFPVPARAQPSTLKHVFSIRQAQAVQIKAQDGENGLDEEKLRALHPTLALLVRYLNAISYSDRYADDNNVEYRYAWDKSAAPPGVELTTFG